MAESSVAQEKAIKTAEVIFCYVAESYLKTSLLAAIATAPKVPAKPVVRTTSFLASACSFQQSTTATSATTISKCTPQEELADELDQYFRFEVAPLELAEEVLLNPLLWLKVCLISYIIIHKFLCLSLGPCS